MPGVRTPSYDRLPQGEGYQSVPVPKNDAAETPDLEFNVPDSKNDEFEMKVVSLETKEQRAPDNPWNTWTSGWRSEAQIGHDDGAVGAK